MVYRVFIVRTEDSLHICPVPLYLDPEIMREALLESLPVEPSHGTDAPLLDIEALPDEKHRE